MLKRRGANKQIMDIDTNVVDSLNIFGLQHHKNWNEGTQKIVGQWTLTLLNIEKMLDFTLVYIKK